MMRAPASAAENPAQVSPTPALTAPGSRSRTFSGGSGRLPSRRPGLMSGSARLRMGTSRPPVGMPRAASNTATRLNGHGIHTGADLREQTLAFLQRHFGKAGTFYYWISRGGDERPVRADRVRKSVGAENTF